MFKKFSIFLCLILISSNLWASNLLEVYAQALRSDAIYQQAIAQTFASRQEVPINLANILPQVLFNMNANVTRTGFAGTDLTQFNTITFAPRNTTQRNYTMTLSVTQTIFDFSKFARVRGALATARNANANLNAALQDLMVRVAKAYFDILRDEDNLRYTKASKKAYQSQLHEVTEQFKVGIKTQTDVYTAQASYDAAVADVIAAETQLADDKENLRVITGKYYEHLAPLSAKFPLLTPKPAHIDAWVVVAQQQNWNVVAARYNVESVRQTIKEKVAHHLPTLDLTGRMDRLYQDNINGYNTLNDRNGPGTQTDKVIGLNLNLPLFTGGGTTAATNQAIYNYQVAQQQLEQTLRNALNTTRQSYLGIIAGVSKIKADQLSIKSAQSSLSGMEESYKVGTETLVNVLNQQQKVFEAQLQYSKDRYKFVTDVLTLKQAAGTLSFEDMCGINLWLR
jgi:outer membrane protein